MADTMEHYPALSCCITCFFSLPAVLLSILASFCGDAALQEKFFRLHVGVCWQAMWYPYFVNDCAVGIGYSDDKMLQTRIFSYADTQRYRLGPNYLMLPVNAPKNVHHNNHHDGVMNFMHRDEEVSHSALWNRVHSSAGWLGAVM